MHHLPSPLHSRRIIFQEVTFLGAWKRKLDRNFHSQRISRSFGWLSVSPFKQTRNTRISRSWKSCVLCAWQRDVEQTVGTNRVIEGEGESISRSIETTTKASLIFRNCRFCGEKGRKANRIFLDFFFINFDGRRKIVFEIVLNAVSNGSCREYLQIEISAVEFYRFKAIVSSSKSD